MSIIVILPKVGERSAVARGELAVPALAVLLGGLRGDCLSLCTALPTADIAVGGGTRAKRGTRTSAGVAPPPLTAAAGVRGEDRRPRGLLGGGVAWLRTSSPGPRGGEEGPVSSACGRRLPRFEVVVVWVGNKLALCFVTFRWDADFFLCMVSMHKNAKRNTQAVV